MQRYPMTPEGHKALEDELKQLKTVERPRITTAIAEAREHGDLKENAEYHAAREQQGFCEARIRDIEAKLSGAQIIDPAKLPKEGRVVFGVTVVLENMMMVLSVAIKLSVMMKQTLKSVKSRSIHRLRVVLSVNLKVMKPKSKRPVDWLSLRFWK